MGVVAVVVIMGVVIGVVVGVVMGTTAEVTVLPPTVIRRLIGGHGGSGGTTILVIMVVVDLIEVNVEVVAAEAEVAEKAIVVAGLNYQCFTNDINELTFELQFDRLRLLKMAHVKTKQSTSTFNAS
jgi:hypothetical protein